MLLLVDALTSDVSLKYHVCFFEKFCKHIVNVGSNIIKNAATNTASNSPAKARDSVNSTITATLNFNTSTKTKFRLTAMIVMMDGQGMTS